LEASFGLARDLNPHWSLGLELRDHNELPDYRKWENTAVFLGPALSYRQEKWWAALTVMPQSTERTSEEIPMPIDTSNPKAMSGSTSALSLAFHCDAASSSSMARSNPGGWIIRVREYGAGPTSRIEAIPAPRQFAQRNRTFRGRTQ
jgi:hypothetical protein